MCYCRNTSVSLGEIFEEITVHWSWKIFETIEGEVRFPLSARTGNILQFRRNWILPLTSCSVTVNFWNSCVFSAEGNDAHSRGTCYYAPNNFVICVWTGRKYKGNGVEKWKKCFENFRHVNLVESFISFFRANIKVWVERN